MITVLRPVYYCEHCKRHRLSKNAILQHEPRCIYNPQRSECGWHDAGDPMPHAADLTATFKDGLDTDWLRQQCGGCPACMLAVVVQADLSTAERDECGFNYQGEVERFRAEEREDRTIW